MSERVLRRHRKEYEVDPPSKSPSNEFQNQFGEESCIKGTFYLLQSVYIWKWNTKFVYT